MRLVTRALFLALATTVTSQAITAEEKPVVSVKSRAIDASLTIDGRLKAYPPLYDDLLAEGRRQVAKWRATADQQLRKEPEFFSDGRKWSGERTYSQRSVVVDRYVSVLRDDATYEGGAHPNSYTDTILWDREVKKRISVRPFFNETADGGPTMTALAQRVRIAVAIAKMERADSKDEKVSPEKFAAEDPLIADGIQAKLLKLGPLSLAPSTVVGKSSGFTIHFSAYAVGSYAEGPYTVFVPWRDFQQFLSPAGQAIFGGERPKEDEAEY